MDNDSTIEREMMNVLSSIEAARSFFITFSFKSVTRNVEKLFQIIEFLLTRGLPFVTPNVYLNDGHVEKRVKPLRAGHNQQESNNNISNTSGLGYRHRQVLNGYLKIGVKKQ